MTLAGEIRLHLPADLRQGVDVPLADGRQARVADDGSLLVEHPHEQALERYVEHFGRQVLEVWHRGDLVFRYDRVERPETA